jgi:putative ABC transport system permease protein
MTGVLDSLLRELRSTWRILAVRPGWTMAAILCLAIATGANTAAFTLVNGLLLRPLPFERPDELVMVALQEPTQAGPRPFSLREYTELSEQSATTIQLLARTFFPVSLTADDGARMVEAEMVSSNYFDTLRVSPFVGRVLDRRDDRVGSAPAAVLSHRLWSLRFRSDPTVVGQTVRVNGRPVLIAGVAPPGFVGAMRLVAADLWLPAITYRDLAGTPDVETVPMFGVMGRLAPGVLVTDAGARLTPLAATLARARGVKDPPTVVATPARGFGVPVAGRRVMSTVSGLIYLMMALLMAIACANVAALVLARGVGRSREIAVRLSLGATRVQLARQLIVESSVLALAGCAVGSLVAIWLTQAFVARLTTPFQYVNYAFDVRPDVRVFLYSALATALAAVFCGVVPIRHAGKVDVADVLRQSAAKGRSRESRRTLNAMVAIQFAVSTTLLVAAGMLVRAYISAESAKPVFDSAGVIAVTLDAGQVRLDRPAGVQLYQTVLERLKGIPAVTEIGLTRELPLSQGQTVTVLADSARQGRDAGERATVGAMVVSSRYFQTLGLPIRGRSFDDSEPARPLAAIVNEAMARRLWPNVSPLGQTFRVSQPDAESIEVVGVVPNLDQGSDTREPRPAFFRPFPHEYAARMSVVLRARANPSALFADVRRTVREVNRDLAIVDLRTMEDALDSYAQQRRVPATALALVGLLGLLLSAVGLHGVIAYSVRERARELGIRLALGARPTDVRRLVLKQGFKIVGIGLILGGAGTFVFAQVMRSTVFGVGTIDPATILAVCTVLLGAGFAALYLPARWASLIEPAHTLRND